MSSRLETLQVARLAPTLLGPDASLRVAAFLEASFAPGGCARDRSGESDLYFTVFALEGLVALRREPPVALVRPYLERFGDGDGLDLVHLAALARCRASLPPGSLDPGRAARIAKRLEAAHDEGSVYGAFLLAGALEDLGVPIRDPDRLAREVLALALPDGSFPHVAAAPAGSTPTTAAAADLLRRLGAPIPAGTAAWLLARAHAKGGFLAAPDAPIPDVLSTAVALHALSGLRADLAPLRERALDLFDTLWTGHAFCGTWADDEPDVESTWYALLALGHLSLA